MNKVQIPAPYVQGSDDTERCRNCRCRVVDKADDLDYAIGVSGSSDDEVSVRVISDDGHIRCECCDEAFREGMKRGSEVCETCGSTSFTDKGERLHFDEMCFK